MEKRILWFIAVIMFLLGACVMDCPPGTDVQTELWNITASAALIGGAFILGGYASGKEET